MGLLSRKTPIATVRVAFLDGDTAQVEAWSDGSDRQEQSYNAILLFLMHYARILFFLSFRDTADQLVEWMDEAVRDIAGSDGGEVRLTRGTEIVAGSSAEPRAVWTGTLSALKPGEYRCTNEKPSDPEDEDAQRVVLLHLQHLADTLPELERAYLALGITGMHRYYRDVQHWHTSKSLHPAPAAGLEYARSVLERRQ
jgi:hypothetical protein